MTIHITQEAAQMLRFAIEHDPHMEIGGFAKVEQPDNVPGLLITDIIIPPQEVHNAAVDFGTEGFAWAMEHLASRGETISTWNCWWHSHGSMQAFASPTDQKTLETFSKITAEKWAIGIVSNARGEFYSWLSTNSRPWPLTQEKITVTVDPLPRHGPIFDRIANQLLHVKKGTYLFSQSTPNNPLTPHTLPLTWCDQHNNWNDNCPTLHDVPYSPTCPHIPNCGEGGCFSKSERRKLKKLRRPGLEIDPDNIDTAFDAQFDDYFYGPANKEIID